MPFNKNQHGFSPIIVIVGILFLALAAAIGTYYVQKYTQIFKSNASDAVQTASTTPNQPQIPNPSVKINYSSPSPTSEPQTDQIVSYDPSSEDQLFTLFNLQNAKSQPFLKDVINSDQIIYLTIPNSRQNKLIIFTADKTLQRSDLFNLNKNLHFYFCDNPCTEPVELNRTQIESKLNQKAYWVIENWVEDSSSKVIISSYSEMPKPSQMNQSEVSVLDINTMELSTLLTDQIYMTAGDQYYLSPQTNQLLVLNKNQNDFIVSSFQLENNKRTDYPRGKIANFHPYSYGIDGSFGPYYAQTTPNEDVYNLKTIQIKSESNKHIGTALITSDLNDWVYTYAAFWSHTSNHFAILVHPKNPGTEASLKLLIYNKEGELSGSLDIQFQDKDFQKSAYNYRVLFSPDETRAILAASGGNDWKWLLFPVSPNAKITKEFVNKDLGIPVIWNTK